jgi:hypothetical protein
MHGFAGATLAAPGLGAIAQKPKLGGRSMVAHRMLQIQHSFRKVLLIGLNRLLIGTLNAPATAEFGDTGAPF